MTKCECRSAVCLSHRAPYYLSADRVFAPPLRRRKIKPKQDARARRKKTSQVVYKAVICKMNVLDAITVWLGQSVKLRAADSNAMEEEGNSKCCSIQGWQQLWSLCPSVSCLKYELETTQRHSTRLRDLSAHSIFLPIYSGTCAIVCPDTSKHSISSLCLTSIFPLPPKPARICHKGSRGSKAGSPLPTPSQ